MRYRDRQTGKFVSRATWKRSKAHAGTRFVRERPKKKPVKRIGGGRGPKKKKIIGGGRNTHYKEYAIKLDYGSRKAHNVIDAEVHLFGPEATRTEVRAIYERWWKTGDLPRSWQVRAISWRHAARGRWRTSDDSHEVRDALKFVLEKKPRSIDIK